MSQLQGLFFRDIANDYVAHILKEIYFDKIYDPFFIDRKATVVDIGANIGLFSYYASSRADKVYSVEPASQHQQTLKQMIDFNSLKNVIPVQKALAATNGKQTFYHNANTTMFSLKEAVNGLPEEAEEVETITFNKLFDLYDIKQIDMLKLDCEGSEADILASDGFEAVADKIKLIVGEYHTWSGVNPQLFSTYLTDRGFKFNWLNQTEASVFVSWRE